MNVSDKLYFEFQTITKRLSKLEAKEKCNSVGHDFAVQSIRADERPQFTPFNRYPCFVVTLKCGCCGKVEERTVFKGFGAFRSLWKLVKENGKEVKQWPMF